MIPRNILFHFKKWDFFSIIVFEKSHPFSNAICPIFTTRILVKKLQSQKNIQKIRFRPLWSDA